MDQLGAMRAFVRVVDNSGFSEAARQLGVAVSSVTRQVSGLEDELGTRLLFRSTRSVTLTDAGRIYYDHVLRILAEVDEADRSVSGMDSSPTGLLRITAPVAFGRLHIAPAISKFMEKYPSVELDVVLTDMVISLVDDGIDIAIRIGEPASSSLIGRKLASHRRVVCASPEYLARHGEPAVPTDLVDHDCMMFRYLGRHEVWRFGRKDREGIEEIRVRGKLRTNNSELLRASALAGAGIIMMPTWLIGDDLQRGDLVELLPDWDANPAPFDTGIHALYLANRKASLKVRAFIDFLVEHFGRPPYWDRPINERATSIQLVPPA